MKGFILAAGLGTRLKPWTEHHPKALVPVGGVPILERIIIKFYESGISDITVNCFHFADQIKDFIKSKGWNINIVDEQPILLETGGAILNAAPFLEGDRPVIIHNVDILSNADLNNLGEQQADSNALATLLVSSRQSSRKLIFDSQYRLVGWHALTSDEYKPEGFNPKCATMEFSELAFSGIYAISPSLIESMRNQGWIGRFSIMDFFLSSLSTEFFKGIVQRDLELIDIGKPDSLNRANVLFNV